MTVNVFDTNNMEWADDARFPGTLFKVLETRASHPSISLVRAKVDIGGAIPTHIHLLETETAFVLSGEAVLKHDDNESRLTAGMGVTIRPGTPHSLHNVGDVPVELLAMHSPATR